MRAVRGHWGVARAGRQLVLSLCRPASVPSRPARHVRGVDRRQPAKVRHNQLNTNSLVMTSIQTPPVTLGVLSRLTHAWTGCQTRRSTAGMFLVRKASPATRQTPPLTSHRTCLFLIIQLLIDPAHARTRSIAVSSDATAMHWPSQLTTPFVLSVFGISGQSGPAPELTTLDGGRLFLVRPDSVKGSRECMCVLLFLT